jgi:phenylpyruvate tautomerase PptA (4-oxalocrotonate tautomerase family)
VQEHRYRVVVGVPQATLVDDAKAGLAAEVTEQILRAEKNGQDPALEDAFRVCVIVNEITDGNWGGVGRIFRLADIMAFAGASEKDIQRRAAGFTGQPYRRGDLGEPERSRLCHAHFVRWARSPD